MDSPHEDRPLKRNDKLGPYSILELLGEGSTARVYRARHTGHDRIDVIKVSKTRDDAQRFLAEAKRVSNLNHPNISLLYTMDILPDGRTYLAFQYLKGESLRKVIQKKGHLPWQEAVRIAKNIADALAYAHERKDEEKKEVIHRDIKPENILITEDGSAVLLDFGIGQTVREATALHIPFSGSIEYASPEQIIGRPYGIHWHTDIYSLGIVLYEMLSGERPLPSRRDSPLKQLLESDSLSDEERNSLCTVILQSSYKPLKSTIPKPLVAICKKCLEFNPDDRFTAEHLKQALKKCLFIKAEHSLKILCTGVIAVFFCISFVAYLYSGVAHPEDHAIDLPRLFTIALLGIVISIINGIVWYKIDETYGWEYLAGSGEHMPIGWSAVALSISVTSSLLLVPLVIPLLFSIPTFAILRHLAACFPCVVGGAVGHLCMYGLYYNRCAGFRRWIGQGDFIRATSDSGGLITSFMQPEVWRLLFQEFTYTFVYFLSIVLPYLYVSRIPLPLFERFRPLQTTYSALFFFLLVSAYIVLFYPRSLNDARFVQFRGLWSAALLQIAFCAAMYL